MVRMRVSTSSSEFMVLWQLILDCFLLVGTELLSQVKEFKCFGVFFRSDGEVCEIDRQIGAPSVGLAALIQAFVVKRALSEGETLNLFQSSSGYEIMETVD